MSKSLIIFRLFNLLTYLLGFDQKLLLGSKTPWQRGAAAVSGNCRLAPNESETDEPELDISSRAATLWHWTHKGTVPIEGEGGGGFYVPVKRFKNILPNSSGFSPRRRHPRGPI